MADLGRIARFIHINPKLGKITVDHMSPVVAMKKIKLGPSDASGLAATTYFLPELTDADDNQDYESQRARREGAVSAAQNEDVPFVNTLTQDELNNHVQKCLEMSSENKINQKNAFALQLIDCFSFLQKKKDFSAMACTLDAGTKIYSCRVDALHQQVVKLADEVVMSSREERTDKDGEDGKSLAGKGSTKEQRRTRKNKLIASSESLTRQMKARDPKDKYLRFEPLPGAILSGARRDASDLSLSLERYTPFWPNWDNYKPLKAEGVVSLPDVKIFREKSQTVVLEIPPSLPEADEHQINAEQAFDDNDDNDKNVFEEKNLPETEMIVPNPPSEQYSDNDGENHSVTDDIENLVSSASRSGEDEVGVVSTAMNRLKAEAEADGAVNRAPSRMEALKILFDVSSEYDYLKMKNRNYWAGPEFWKRPQVVRTESDKEKRKVSNKKREPAEIVYDFQDLDERLLVLGKRGTSLSERVVRSWKNKRTTLPRDLKVDSSWFLNLFHLDSCGEQSEVSEIVQKSTSFVDVLETFEEDEEITDNSTDPITDPFTSDHEDTSNSPDPMNATFYEAASPQSENSEPRDPLDSTFYDAGPSNKAPGKIIRVEVASSSVLEFGESYMVPAPKMVNVDPIKYSTRPIRVDMQHLKNAMLTVIREEVERDAREKKILIVPDDAGSAETKPGARFRDVLKSLPRKLERRTREDVSMPIAFTAVLSLANENSLQLEKCDDGDFVVRFPDSPVLVSEEESDVESRLQ